MKKLSLVIISIHINSVAAAGENALFDGRKQGFSIDAHTHHSLDTSSLRVKQTLSSQETVLFF